MAKVGEFELLVILAILQQQESPYANAVRERLESNSGRTVTRGALYRTLDRLESKRLVEWDSEPSRTPERGGHPMRRLRVTRDGVEAARSARELLLSSFEGLGPVLDRK